MGSGAERLAVARRLAPRWITPRARQLPTKRARADLLTLALAALLVRGGERVTLLGSGLAPATAAPRSTAWRCCSSAPAHDGASLPAFEPLPRYGQIVLIGDLLAPLDGHRCSASRRFAAPGVKGHLLQVLDPAEETLPFAGRVRFEGLEHEEPLLIGRVETIRAPISRSASRGTARACGARPRRRAGASACTAPTGRRTRRCSALYARAGARSGA